MGYIGNEQEWKRLMAVDWLGQYVKAWIAFNAWYRNAWSKNNFKLPKDREIIEEIKNDEGDVCSKIERCLLDSSTGDKSFQSEVADLHSSLSQAGIKSNKKRISFEEIEDYKHAKYIKETKNRITYKIKICADQKERIVIIKNSENKEIFNKTIKRRDEGHMPSKDWFEPLTSPQKETLKAFLNESTPIHNLITSSSDCIQIGGFSFINNPNIISRAIIEILYQLRNALFHGEITPDSETQKVYKPAYLILESIIPER